MHQIRFITSDEQYQQLIDNAEAKGLTIQQYIRQVLFKEDENGSSTVITVDEAFQRALNKFIPGEEFAVRDIFSEDEWLNLKNPAIFGKLFYKAVLKRDDIQLVRMGRQAVYTIIKKNGGTADE